MGSCIRARLLPVTSNHVWRPLCNSRTRTRRTNPCASSRAMRPSPAKGPSSCLRLMASATRTPATRRRANAQRKVKDLASANKAAETVSGTVPDCCWQVSGAKSATGALFIASHAVRIGPTPRQSSPPPPPPPRHPACPPNPPGLSRPARPPRHPQSRLLLSFVPFPKKNPIFRPNPPAGDEYLMDSGPAAPPPLVRRRCSLTIEYRLIRHAATASASVIRHSALAIPHISGSFQGQNRVI